MSAIKHRNGMGGRPASLGTTAAIILIVVAFVTGVVYVTKPFWHRFLYPTTSVTVPVSKPRVTQVKHPTKPTTPTKPTQPTQPSLTQTFPTSTTAPAGEQILGNPYWKTGLLYEDPGDTPTTPSWWRNFYLIFNLPAKTELRSPIDGVVVAAGVASGTSSGFFVDPTPSLMNRQEGAIILYVGDSLNVLVKIGQSVTKGEVVATVSNPNISLLVSGKTLSGNVLVGYSLYSPQAKAWESTLAATRVAFSYVSEPK